MTKVLEFDLTLNEYPVKLKDKDGNVKEYILREMDGKARDAYLTNMSGRMTVKADGKTTVSNFNGLQASLITRCLFDKEGKQVPDTEIQSWPSRVQTLIHKECQEICGLNLDEEDEEAVKND